MELYILDSLNRLHTVVENYESLIWAERFNAVGDFELHVFSTLENRARFVSGTKLGLDQSKRVMKVETTQDITDEEGRRILKVTGFSLEQILKHRILAKIGSISGDLQEWGPIEGLPKAIAELMYSDICVDIIINDGDAIPEITMGSSIYPSDTISAPTEEIISRPKIQTLYASLKELCDEFAMGLRIVRDPATSSLYFDIYMGSDRTTAQTTLPPVVFSPDLDNLRNTNRVESSANYKNVAYVYNDTDHVLVYRDTVDPSISGFDRKVLIVNASNDFTVDDLTRIGREELAKNNLVSILDGEIAANSSYKYEEDYYLGDLVELRDSDGTTSYMQVVEQIFVSDKEGERTYPTVRVNSFITPGSWIAWDYAQEWDDLGATEYWEDQP